MTALPPLIGLSGYAGSGKSTLARLLAERHGYQVRHFADPLRELCRKVNPIIWQIADGAVYRWADVEARGGYEAAKAHRVFGAEFRGTLQRMGTEVRAVLGEDVWVDAGMIGLDIDSDIVFADCRFPNEAEAVLGHYGRDLAAIIRIERPGVGPVNGHVSETALDGWKFDTVLVNDGSPEQMLEQLAAVYALPEVTA